MSEHLPAKSELAPDLLLQEAAAMVDEELERDKVYAMIQSLQAGGQMYVDSGQALAYFNAMPDIGAEECERKWKAGYSLAEGFGETYKEARRQGLPTEAIEAQAVLLTQNTPPEDLDEFSHKIALELLKAGITGSNGELLQFYQPQFLLQHTDILAAGKVEEFLCALVDNGIDVLADRTYAYLANRVEAIRSRDSIEENISLAYSLATAYARCGNFERTEDLLDALALKRCNTSSRRLEIALTAAEAATKIEQRSSWEGAALNIYSPSQDRSGSQTISVAAYYLRRGDFAHAEEHLGEDRQRREGAMALMGLQTWVTTYVKSGDLDARAQCIARLERLNSFVRGEEELICGVAAKDDSIGLYAPTYTDSRLPQMAWEVHYLQSISMLNNKGRVFAALGKYLARTMNPDLPSMLDDIRELGRERAVRGLTAVAVGLQTPAN